MEIDNLFEHTLNHSESEKELFEYLYARFLYLTRRKVSNREDCEEIVQSALLSVFDNFRKVQIDKSYANWAFRILQNKIIDYYRSGKNGMQLEPIFDNTATLAEDPILKIKLLDCLNKINRANITHARMLVLKYQGFSFEEICTRLDLTKNNAYSVLSRARTMLQHCLDKGEIK